MPRFGPFDVNTQPGEPVTVGSRQLTPIVRLVQLRRLGGTTSAGQQGLGGCVLVMASPVAIQVLDEQGEHTLPVIDPVRPAMLSLLAGFAMIPLLSLLITQLTTRRPPSHKTSPEGAVWN